MLTISACQSAIANPPRLATATAQAETTITENTTPLVIPAPTSTPSDDEEDEPQFENTAANPVISIWVNETSPEHRAMLEEVAAGFTDKYQIDVELMLVSSFLLPDLVSTAVLSNTLPDIIIHPLEYTHGWAERGVFNIDAATTAINQIGIERFNSNALDLLNTPSGIAAIPSDGYAQILVYRQDWVEQFGVPDPTNYDDMFTFAEASFDGEQFLTAGFVIPTESNLVTTHQAFEHIARANGCDLITLAGEVDILSDACAEALDFYYNIVHNFSPPGIQTVSSTQNAYLNGRGGMIMISPSILPMLAGLDPDNMPTCPECEQNSAYLAENSRIFTGIASSASADPVGFSTVTSLGITSVAEEETAVLFAEYWFNEAYLQWLSINSERKVPMYQGTFSDPSAYIDPWGTTPLVPNGPSIAFLFGDSIVNDLKTNIGTSTRWGIPQGQGALLTTLYEDLTISIVLQEMLSGYFDTSQTSFEAYNRVIELIPNYQFPVIEPTETP